MSNYVKSTNFATKDALASGNPLKIVKGTEIDTEFNNIATAVATKVDSSGGTLTNCTGLPVSTGVAGLGTGVATALAVNVGSAGAPVVNGGALGTPSSGTLTNATGLPLTTGVTGTLPVANGGTGTTSLTANNVILGNGTSAVQVVAPGASGNVLTSNGTTWTSTTPTTPTAFGDIGTYAVLMMAVNTNLATGSTIAGSSLRYDFSPNTASPGTTSNSTPFVLRRVQTNNSTYGGGGTSLSGTWRKMSSGSTYVAVSGCGSTDYYWWEALYVRIS